MRHLLVSAEIVIAISIGQDLKICYRRNILHNSRIYLYNPGQSDSIWYDFVCRNRLRIGGHEKSNKISDTRRYVTDSH